MTDQRTDGESGALNEQWQELRVGDQIRMVQMPTGFSRQTCSEDTLQAYQRIIERRRPLRVAYLEEWEGNKYPWIRFQLREDGVIHYHSLMINHDGWVRVVPRKK